MIAKCKRLKNVGKFYDFLAQANALDWHKNTFVFAHNAYGKATLVSVLRSLRDHDPKVVRARKTLGLVFKPEDVLAPVSGMSDVTTAKVRGETAKMEGCR